MSRQLGRTSTSPPHLSQASLRANAGISVPAGQRETANQGLASANIVSAGHQQSAHAQRAHVSQCRRCSVPVLCSHISTVQMGNNQPAGRRRQRLAPAASSLRQTATAATAPAASTPSTPSTASPRELHAGLRCSGVFLVEDIESRQADVRDFLLTESNHGTRCGVLR